MVAIQVASNPCLKFLTHHYPAPHTRLQGFSIGWETSYGAVVVIQLVKKWINIAHGVTRPLVRRWKELKRFSWTVVL